MLEYLLSCAEALKKHDGKKALSANYFVISLLKTINEVNHDQIPSEINSEEAIKELEAVSELLRKYYFNNDRAIELIAGFIASPEYNSSMDEFVFGKINYYDLDFTLDEIRPSYRFDVTCMGSVPQAIECFLEAHDFEDAIRNAISLGGDGDTIAAIAGAIAEAYFGIPDELQEEVLEYMDDNEKDWYFEYSDQLY